MIVARIMADKVEIRRYRRLLEWDYSKGASLFITIAVNRSNAVRPSSLASHLQPSSLVSHPQHSSLAPCPQSSLLQESASMARQSSLGWPVSPFGRVVHGQMILSELGGIVAESLQKIPVLNPGISLHGWVVMPDHVHFNCHLAVGLDEPLKVLGYAIRRFKNYTTKMAKILVERSSTISTAAAITTGLSNSIDPAITTASGGLATGKAGYGREASEDGRTAFGQYGQLWQQGYHDHLCLSRRFIDSTERYIACNSMKWELIHGSGDSLRNLVEAHALISMMR